MVERSIEMVVGLLGVLKAGAAYVPLDPGSTRERLKYMVEDSGARLVLTQREFIVDYKRGSQTSKCFPWKRKSGCPIAMKNPR